MSVNSSGPKSLTVFWRFIRRVAELLVFVVFRWRVDVQGLEHVPRHGGAVLVWNHHSYFDFVMVAWAIVRRLGRPVRFLAKREIWDSWKARWIVNGALAIPVDRGHAVSAMRDALAALRDGDLVVVAPEETISRSFELLPFKTGAVRMAQAAGVPVVPAVGWGSHRFLTKGHGPHLARRVPVVVRYGRPIHVAPGEDVVAATERVREAMSALLDEVQRSYPDGAPAGAWWVPARLGGGAPSHEEVLAEHRSRHGSGGDGGRDGAPRREAS